MHSFTGNVDLQIADWRLVNRRRRETTLLQVIVMRRSENEYSIVFRRIDRLVRKRGSGRTISESCVRRDNRLEQLRRRRIIAAARSDCCGRCIVEPTAQPFVQRRLVVIVPRTSVRRLSANNTH